MSSDYIELRNFVLKCAINEIPVGFLVEVYDRTRRGYMDEYLSVLHSPTTLVEQRLFKLAQDRCFRLDWELSEAAKKHNLAATSKELVANKWNHTYVSSGRFGITQSCVRNAGDLPNPAKFRDILAEAANCPKLPLDDPAEIYSIKEFYGLLVHNPIGREFSEGAQKLGSMLFCVPDKSMKSWILSISVGEMIALYPKEKKELSRVPSPTWKRQKQTGTE